MRLKAKPVVQLFINNHGGKQTYIIVKSTRQQHNTQSMHCIYHYGIISLDNMYLLLVIDYVMDNARFTACKLRK